jgi:hypothetical protein
LGFESVRHAFRRRRGATGLWLAHLLARWLTIRPLARATPAAFRRLR